MHSWDEHGSPASPARTEDALWDQPGLSMLGNSALWETAWLCQRVLSADKIPFAVRGSVAVCLHGYARNTLDIDLLVRTEDADRIRVCFGKTGLEWRPGEAEYLSPTGIPVQFFLAGDRAGPGSDVRFPDPAKASNVSKIEGVSVLSLARLIDAKIACGEASLRRTHKDFADVVELIAVNRLDSSFARFVNKSLRKTFRDLIRRSRGE